MAFCETHAIVIKMHNFRSFLHIFHQKRIERNKKAHKWKPCQFNILSVRFFVVSELQNIL